MAAESAAQSSRCRSGDKGAHPPDKQGFRDRRAIASIAAADATERPSEMPTGTSVGMRRIVRVTGATRIVRSTGIASSLVRTRNGRPFESASRPPDLAAADRHVTRAPRRSSGLLPPGADATSASSCGTRWYPSTIRRPTSARRSASTRASRAERTGVRLRLESAGRDQRLELLGEGIWYANRNLNRHAKSIPPALGYSIARWPTA